MTIPPCPKGLPVWPPAGTGNANAPYRLQGPQVEPAASYWTECNPPCVVTIEQVLKAGCQLPPYPTNPATLKDEIDELMELASLRDNPEAVTSKVKGRERRAVSAFLQIRPQPVGAVFNRERAHDRCNDRCDSKCGEQCDGRPDDDDVPVVWTGRELARYFESETPGLAHRHALNFLIRDTNWSPPRQALVWMALDVAIYSALSAAWYFKWRGPQGVSRRQRPIEYDYRVSVLYNRAVDCDGDADGERRPCPEPSPGTPRHPAYPSGHSTYSAAASEILSYFFPDYTAEFDNLADNAGMARLWAGIHWRSDHEQGAKLGRCVARLVIAQLRASCVTAPPSCCDVPDPCEKPPTIDALNACAKACCERRPSHTPEAEDTHTEAEAPARKEAVIEREGEGGERSERELPSSAYAEQAEGPQEGAAPTSSGKDEQAQARSPQEGAQAGSKSTEAETERAEGPQEGAG